MLMGQSVPFFSVNNQVLATFVGTRSAVPVTDLSLCKEGKSKQLSCFVAHTHGVITIHGVHIVVEPTLKALDMSVLGPGLQGCCSTLWHTHSSKHPSL